MQASEGERSGRIVLLDKLKCPECRAADAFEPERPIVCLIACQLLAERATPLENGTGSNDGANHNNRSSSMQFQNVAPALKEFSSKSKRALLKLSKKLSNSSRLSLVDASSSSFSSRTREDYIRRERQLAAQDLSDHPQPHEARMVVFVSGAGQPRVNGIYSFDGYFENAVKYSMMTMAGEYSLFRYRINETTMAWYLSLVPRNKQPGSTTDIDFYVAWVNNDDSGPLGGACTNPWSCTEWKKSSYGLDPSPTLEVLEY